MLGKYLIYIFLLIGLNTFGFAAQSSINSFSELPSNGRNSALVIIDMQDYFVLRGGSAKKKENEIKLERVLQKQIEAIKEAKKFGIAIVFIEYEDCGPTNQRLKQTIGGYKKVTYITKDTDGMFDKDNMSVSQINNFFKINNVTNLIILGANGGACVQRSIEGALENGVYNVYSYSQGVADFNYDNFIYPYDDIYNFEKNGIKGACQFKEVDSIGDVIAIINNQEVLESGKNIIDARLLSAIIKKTDFQMPRDATRVQTVLPARK